MPLNINNPITWAVTLKNIYIGVKWYWNTVVVSSSTSKRVALVADASKNKKFYSSQTAYNIGYRRYSRPNRFKDMCSDQNNIIQSPDHRPSNVEPRETCHLCGAHVLHYMGAGGGEFDDERRRDQRSEKNINTKVVRCRYQTTTEEQQ